MNEGLLTCDDVSKCPSECGVCASCIHSICNPPLPTVAVVRGVKANAGISLAVIGSVVLLAAVVYHVRKNNDDDLNENLIGLGKDGQPTIKKKFWKGKTSKVWLVPDLKTVPTKTLFPDLLEKGETVERSAPKKQRKRGNPVITTSGEVSVQSDLSSQDGAGYTAPMRLNHYKRHVDEDDSNADYIEQRIRASQSRYQ